MKFLRQGVEFEVEISGSVGIIIWSNIRDYNQRFFIETGGILNSHSCGCPAKVYGKNMCKHRRKAIAILKESGIIKSIKGEENEQKTRNLREEQISTADKDRQ